MSASASNGSSAEQLPHQKKKRNRTPASCNICRSRKVKCDKTRPVCQACKDSNFESLCEFLQPSWINTGNNKDLGNNVIVIREEDEDSSVSSNKRSKTNSHESERLKFLESQVERLTQLIQGNATVGHGFHKTCPILNHPPVDDNDTINFFELPLNYFQRRNRVMVQGPFSWILLLKQDQFVRIFWMVMASKKRGKRQETTTNPLEGEYVVDKRLLNKVSRKINNIDLKKKQISKKPKADTLPLTVDMQDIYETIIRNAIAILPTKRTMWMLIDRFFSHLYPMVPYLDQQTFLSCVNLILGERDMTETKITEINVRHKLQIVTLGLLLVILRFTSISLINNGPPVEEQIKNAESDEIRYLLQNPVDVEAIAVAQLCLGQFRMLRKIAFGVLQLAFYLRLYICYAPEDGDGEDGSDSASFTTLLLGLAISSGLYRDPSNFKIENKRANLWRKLWFGILTFQSYQNHTVGYPPLVLTRFNDTKAPVFDPLSSNIDDIELEEQTLLGINGQCQLDCQVNKVLQLTLNLRENPRVIDVIAEVSKIEDFISLNMGSINKIYLNSSSGTKHFNDLRKIRHLIKYLEMKCFLFTIYYHLALHFEAQEDASLCSLYFIKLLDITAEFAATFPNIYSTSLFIGDRGYDIFYTPIVLKGILLTVSFLLSVIVRFEHRLAKDQGNKTIRRTIVQSKKCLSLLVFVIKLYSDKNYHAFRSSKFCQVMCELLDDDDCVLFDVTKTGCVKLSANISNCEIPNINIVERLSDELLTKFYDSISDERLRELKVDVSTLGIPSPLASEASEIFNDPLLSRERNKAFAAPPEPFSLKLSNEREVKEQIRQLQNYEVYPNLSNHHAKFSGPSNRGISNTVPNLDKTFLFNDGLPTPTSIFSMYSGGVDVPDMLLMPIPDAEDAESNDYNAGNDIFSIFDSILQESSLNDTSNLLTPFGI